MKKATIQSFLLFGFIGFCNIQAQAQTACTNFPVPQITLTIGATMQGSGISIANVPAGATSSLTLVTSTEIPNVLNDVYRAKMQLNGCSSEKLIRHSPNRNIEERYSTGCYRIVHKATGKVLEVVGNSQAEDAPIRLATANGNSNQLWQLVPDMYLVGFVSKSSGKWLTLNGDACTDGTSLKQTTNKFLYSQRLSNIRSGMLASCFGSNKFLKAAANGSDVIVGTGDTTDTFQWTYELAPCPAINCPTIPPITGASTACVGSTIKLTAPSIKENGAWAISNASVQGRITSDGTVTPLRVGTATVTFSVIEGGCLNSVSKTIVFQDCTPISFDPNKCYQIGNKASGKVLEIKDESQAEGAAVQQWSNMSDRGSNKWQIIKRADGTYNIVARSSRKLMDAPDCTEGGLVKQFAADGTGSQNWEITKLTDGTFKIKNVTCNKMLGVENSSTADGGSVGTRTDNGTNAFVWMISEVGCSDPISPNWCYHIINKATNKALEVKDAAQTEGAQIYQWTTTPNRKQQVWQLRDRTQNVFDIISQNSGKLMDALNCTEGTIVKQFAFDGTNGQNWKFELQADGYYKIKDQSCNKYLRVEGPSTADGHEVGVKNDFGTDAFKWYLQSAPCISPLLSATPAATFGFEARASEGRAKLQWITNTGYKNDYFEVERLNVNGNFDILGRQNAEVSKDMKSYTFTDNDPLDGDNLYRINSISQNAPPQYSDIKKVSFSKNDGISIFPNPADEFINVDLRKYEGKTVSLSVYNSVGLLVKKQTIEKVSATPQQIDVQGFGTGSYLLRVQSEGKREVTRLFHIAK